MTDLLVQTPLGALRGAAAGPNVRAFLGVRYAEPCGRWRRPERIRPWGVKDALQFGAKPPVAPPVGRLPIPLLEASKSAQSEDCHFLNIWAPSAEHIPKGGLPVMIWLYGGALASGETSMDAYSGHRLVARSIEIGKPVIFVSINYRVNVFGYLASKELQEWSGDGSAGNYGFYDQRMGILVAKQIIGSFGGDPNNVTCFGESAGAVSADVLSAAFHGEKLFNRMILQSATVDTMKSKTVAQAQRHFDLFYSKVGGPADLQGRARVEYLLSKSTDDLIKAYAASLPSMIFFPVIDEHFLSTDPSELPRDVDAVLQGTCRDEGTLFSAPLPADSRTARLTELMIRAAVPKPHAAEALQRYSADKHGDAREAYSAYINDAWFQHPSRVHARVVAGQGKKVFRYRMEGEVDSLKKLGLRAFHASDIHFTHHNTHLLSPTERPLADRMAGAWISFAHSGNPGSEFSSDPKQVLVYSHDGVKIEGQDEFLGADMAFWDRVWGQEQSKM